jgi:hypothetical protein
MADRRIMLQLDVSQFIFTPVNQLPQLEVLVLDTLNGETATVREITSRKLAHITNNATLEATKTAFDEPLIDVFLFQSGEEPPPIVFHGPSNAASPPVEDARFAMLRVSDLVYPLFASGGYVAQRIVQAHSYIDLATDQPDPPDDGGAIR